MKPEFWQQRWQRGEIGWHAEEFNRHLTEHWSRLGAPAGGRVLVPLCGKSLDMLWLAGRGHRVLGVELSDIAAAAFFEDNGLSPAVTDEPPFRRYRVDELEILAGDFFDLDSSQAQGISAVYDRAALIALPPQMRPAYAERLAALLPAQVPSLLITLDYVQSQMQGPPFAVSRDEVAELFGTAFEIETIADVDILAESPRFAERGLEQLAEHVYRLRRR
ncbi:MAG: thiopurine S-methyltransferase [Thiohalocapsa sp.]|nr:thiopurine S-methyltransferase [Thiohalocapsa sp.]MCF7991719.1 thiopurine S-methyltransferase [Thiohalocapsa sp.]